MLGSLFDGYVHRLQARRFNMTSGPTYVRIVQAAAALANALKGAGVQGEICVAVLGGDGERLHDAIGRGPGARCKVTDDGDLRKAEIAGVEFRWAPTS
jgi:hypothetical protein